jgi:hypothetical protein
MVFYSVRLILENIVAVYVQQLHVVVGLAALFTAAALFKIHASSPGKVWWRNPGLATDITYALIHGVAAPYFKLPALILVYAALSGTVMKPEEVSEFFSHGGGPLSALPFWGSSFSSSLRIFYSTGFIEFSMVGRCGGITPSTILRKKLTGRRATASIPSISCCNRA